MIKLIISDLDGTLLNKESQLSEDFHGLIDELKERGIYFAIATGRQVVNVKDLFRDYLDEIIIMADNGAYVSYQEKEIFSREIPEDILTELIDFSLSLPNANLLTCGKKTGYVQDLTDEMVEIMEFYNAFYEEVDSLHDVDDEIIKISVCDFEDAKTNTYPLISEKFSDRLEVSASGHVWLDITDKGIDKGVAVKSIQKKFGILPEETVIIGDNDNDVSMMDKARYTYAMKESSPKLRAAAKYEAPSNADDGALKIIRDVLDGKIG